MRLPLPTSARGLSAARPLTLVLLLAAVAGCSSQGGPLAAINSAPPDSDPGCYDHRDRLVRTVTTAAECATLTWVWRPQGRPEVAAAAASAAASSPR